MEILLAESNDALRNALCVRLREEGFTPVAVQTGTDALRLLDAPRFESFLLDWQLPDMTGLAVLREMRTRTLDTPVMILSSRSSVAERVLALDGGADDYLLKPFHMDECMARVRRMVRTYHRKTPSAPGGLYCIADLTVDTERHIATRGGKRLPLSAKECALLELFVSRAGEPLSREEIEQHVAAPQSDPALIPVYIHYLRRKIDADYPLKLLRTVRNRGYMLSGA